MSASAAPASELIRAADAALRAGRLDDADRLWEQVLKVNPAEPRAYFHLGQRALRLGNGQNAFQLLDRAANLSQNEPPVFLHLAIAARMIGDANTEALALNKALTLDPYYFPALLLKGAAERRAGKTRKAAKIFQDAITIAPPDSKLPPDMRAALDDARQEVARNAKALQEHLEHKVAAARGANAGAGLKRFDEALGVLAGTQQVYVQKPALFHFPQLPPIGFYDDALFPWLRDLEAATDDIRGELMVVLKEDNGGIAPYLNHPPGTPLNQWAELNLSPRWGAYYFWKDGARNDAHCAQCPKTAAVLDKLPLPFIPGYAPNVMFSILSPKTHIPAHTGSTNIRLVTHLPLILPGQCAFRVANETRDWEMGRAWVFDDTIDHEAWNNSDHLRVILIIDVWNPYLSEAERQLVPELLSGYADYYDGDIPR